MKAKDFGYGGPTPKQVGQPLVTSPAVGLRAPVDYAGASPVYGRFRGVPTDQGYLDVRDPTGRRPPFLPPVVGPEYGGAAHVAVRLRDQFIMELNVFAGGRSAVLSGGTHQRGAGQVMDSATGYPILGVVGVEAVVPRGAVARLATTVAELRSPTTVRVARKTLVPLPEASSRTIVGGQSCVVMTSSGPCMLAAYRARWSASAASAPVDELWFVELSASGAVTLSRGPAVPAGSRDAPLAYPAITTDLRGDQAFVAWPVTLASGQAAIVSGLASRGSSRQWSLGMTQTSPWPRYIAAKDSLDNGFYVGLSAQTDHAFFEYVLAAVKNNGLPFLARYGGAGGLITTPQEFGVCTEQSHGDVQLKRHPTTGRLLLQLHHNTFYFERSGSGFQTLDDQGQPVDQTMPVTLPGGAIVAPCNVVFPLTGALANFGESSVIGVGYAPGTEFAIASGAAEREPGRIVFNVLSAPRTLISVYGTSVGGYVGAALTVISRWPAQAILAGQLGPVAAPTTALVLGIVQ